MSGVWLLFPFIGPIRLSTVLAFIATLVIVTWFKRSPLLALIAAMGWVGAFEIVYEGVNIFYGRYDALRLFYLVFAMAGWVVAAYVAGIRPHPAMLFAWGGLFLGWVAFGFQSNLYYQPSHFSVAQEAFNMATKDGLAAIFILGATAPFRARMPALAAVKLRHHPKMDGDSVRT
jgi:hypothetical protein